MDMQLCATRAIATIAAVSSFGAAQSEWRQLPVAAGPSARLGHAMAYDSWRDRIVLFGGYWQARARDDTWEFDGHAWTQLTPAHKPPARAGHTMAFDPGTGRVLLFGGDTHSTGYLDDTWEWDGTDWLPRLPATVPPRRKSHVIEYDPYRGTVTMFGGRTSPGTLNDTWCWDAIAGDWRLLHPATSPPPCERSAVDADPINRGLVLYGGDGAIGTQTWLWDGVTWTEVSPASNPGPRSDHTLTADPVRERVVLFGDQNTADTWEWDGARWIQCAPATRPSARIDQDVVFDARRSRLVLFSGWNSDAATWEYAMTRPAWFMTFGAGCPGAAGEPRLASTDRPWLGEAFTTSVSALPGGAAWMLLGFGELEADLAVLGMPDCELLVGPAYGVPLLGIPLATAAGQATLTLPLGQGPGLVGVHFFLQAFAVDPGANALGAVVSNGGRAIVGVK